MMTLIRDDIKPFYDEIGELLKLRGSVKDDFTRDPEYRECRYVVRMCKRMAEKIGRPGIGINEVLSVERSASGHVDYQSKFALYCRELQLGR